MEVVNGYSKGVIGKDMYSDSTLQGMTKEELIGLLYVAQHNYEALLESYGNVQNHTKELSEAKEIRKLSFEIEHYNGNTYMGFEISIKDDGTAEVLQTSNCSLADVDGDYIFDTENSLYRIQSEEPISEYEYEEIRQCYEENTNAEKNIAEWRHRRQSR